MKNEIVVSETLVGMITQKDAFPLLPSQIVAMLQALAGTVNDPAILSIGFDTETGGLYKVTTSAFSPIQKP